MKIKKTIILALLATLALVAFAGTASASSTVVVTPNATAGWGLLVNGDIAVTTNNATGKIVAGPGWQPGGLMPGSVEYRTNSGPGGKPQLYAPASLTGVKFKDLTALKYDTYTTQYADSQWLVHTINVKIDLDGNLGTTGDRYTMVFEPCYTASNCTATIQPLNTWSTWDALASGAIWWSTGSIPGTAFTVPFNSFAPLTSVYLTYPDAAIVFMEIQAGQGSGGFPWNNYVGNLDGVTIGVSGVDTTYDFEPTPQCTTVCYVDANTGSDSNGGTSQADAKKTIMAAVGQVSPGGTVIVAAGTYAENVNLNKQITLQGAGSGTSDTLIAPTSGNGINISAGGTSASDRLVIKDIRITSPGMGINMLNAVSYLTVDNVVQTGGAEGFEVDQGGFPPASVYTDIVISNSSFLNNSGMGFRLGRYSSITGLTITGSHFDGNLRGFYANMDTVVPSVFTQVSVSDSTFNNNTNRAMYLEKLDHAIFTNITVQNNGTGVDDSNSGGIDINLKYGNYQAITFNNATISNNGVTDNTTGVGITVKGRNDGGYTSSPASLTGLHIVGGTFEAPNSARPAISIGNNVVDVQINGANVGANVSPAAGLVDYTDAGGVDATCNWWGSTTGPTNAGNPGGTGSAVISVKGNATFAPWSIASNPGGACTGGLPRTITMGPQAMEGDLKVSPRDTLLAGYDFTMPGKHPAATVRFVGSQVTFHYTCVVGTGSGDLVVPMDDQSYADPQNSPSWYPSGDQHSPLVFQGSIVVPDVCNGGLVRLKAGGTFTTGVTSTDTTHKVNIRWHYSANGSAGGWSGTKSIIPN